MVFSDERGALVGGADAAAGLEAALAYEAERATALTSIRRRHAAIVDNLLVPVAKGVGFVKRKYWFARKEESRLPHHLSVARMEFDAGADGLSGISLVIGFY